MKEKSIGFDEDKEAKVFFSIPPNERASEQLKGKLYQSTMVY